MKETEPPVEDLAQSYNLQAVRCCLELGEKGEEIVRMISAYLQEGWIDYGQAAMMIREIIQPDETDD